MTKTKRPARVRTLKPDPVERARAEAAKIETLTVSPTLAEMVALYHEADIGLRTCPNEPERARHYDRCTALHRAIAAFPAASIADLCAKLPLFRGELEGAEDYAHSNEYLDFHSWRAVVSDLERLADLYGVKLPAAPTQEAAA